jgi:hypothetical protein
VIVGVDDGKHNELVGFGWGQRRLPCLCAVSKKGGGGLTEEMITQLSQLNPEKLGVIARTSAMRYKGSNKSARRIGQELGVAYLLEGSVRRVILRKLGLNR